MPPVAGQGRGTETITYDLRGNVVTRVDPNGEATNWSYDNRNRKITQSVTGGWTYDIAGSLMSATDGSVLTAINQGGRELLT